MTVSELQRMLLYRGHDDMADYLRNSPLNRCVYNVILRHGPKPLPLDMLTLFNEAYYQCVRINYDPTPGIDLHTRYVQEATLRLSSAQSANLIFNIVWGMLRCKKDITFSEECFVNQFFPVMDENAGHELAYLLIKYMAGDRMFPPKHFQPLPTPVDELPMITGKKDCQVWREVTNNFSQNTIERYLELYETPEEQTDLLSMIEGAYAEVGNKSCHVNFTKLHQGIIANVYRQVAEQEASYAEGNDQTYKEQLEELKLKYQDLEESQEYRIKEIEAQHQAELWEMRIKLEEMELSEKQRGKSKAHLFTFTEMAEYVKERFSKAGAEAFTNMLYNLALKHGYLDEEVSKAIDEIVPAVIERDKPKQTVHIPTAHQVNINPKQVTNTYTDDQKE